MTSERWAIPDAWRWATIADMGEVRSGGTPSAHQPANFDEERGVAWITPADMSGHEDTYILRGRRNLTERGLATSGAHLLPVGTVVFSSRAPIGYCCVAAGPLATSQGCKNIILRDEHVPEYLMQYLRYSRDYAENAASGTTFLELSAAKMRSLSVPVPPRREQEVLATVLEHLLKRVRTIRSLLLAIPGLADEQYSRVLAAAYEGNLTRDWRSRHELAAQRRVQLQQVLAEPIRNGLSVRGNDIPPGVRALRLSALRSRRLDLNDVRFLPVSSEKASRFLLAEGDILVSRGNGTRALVGRAAIVEGLVEPTIYPDTAFRLRCDPSVASSLWLSHILNAPQIRQKIGNAARTTAGIWKVRQGDVAGLEIPLPSFKEQQQVIRIVDQALGQVDQTGRGAREANELLDMLQKSILNLAFSGRLAAGCAVSLIEFSLDELRKEAAERKWIGRSEKTEQKASVKMSRSVKSRFDDDVHNKPYLAALIGRDVGKMLAAPQLFEASNLAIADFYKQLMWEIERGHIVESADKFKDAR